MDYCSLTGLFDLLTAEGSVCEVFASRFSLLKAASSGLKTALSEVKKLSESHLVLLSAP